MKNRDLMRSGYKCVTTEELYALEHAARVARSREMARLLRRAFEWLRDRFETKGRMRHA
jgi:hypothetical protein